MVFTPMPKHRLFRSLLPAQARPMQMMLVMSVLVVLAAAAEVVAGETGEGVVAGGSLGGAVQGPQLRRVVRLSTRPPVCHRMARTT